MVERPVKVVLVDDNGGIRIVLRQMVETRTKFEVVGEAVTGEEAIEVVAETTPDLVIMDVNMPGAGGVVATEEIKARWPDIKVVVFSSLIDEHSKKKMLRAGADAYIEKRLAWTEILESIVEIGESIFARTGKPDRGENHTT